MPSFQPTSTNPNIALVVPEDQRGLFLPRLFGTAHFFQAEQLVFNLMSQFSPQDYSGAYWEFYQRAERPLYLAPTSKPRYRMAWEMNGWEGEVSSDAAGIIVTLFALSHLSFHFQSECMSEAYYRLYEYAADHAEARQIFSAID